MIEKLYDKIKKKLKHKKPHQNGTDVGTLNERNRINWIVSVLENIPAGSKILDAGAGELAFKKYCDHLVYVSQDFAQYNGKGDSKGLQTEVWDQSKIDIISDITSIPEEDYSYDAVLCIEVLEHLPDPVLALKEFSRLLRKDGSLILTAPFCSLTHFSPYHFSTGFNRYFYEYHLQQLGFAIVNILENGNYFEYIAQELRRLPYVAEKYSQKLMSGEQTKAINTLLDGLNGFSKSDLNSKELLTFGYHILAKKL